LFVCLFVLLLSDLNQVALFGTGLNGVTMTTAYD